MTVQRPLTKILVILAVLAVATVARATSWYVTKAGSDANPCTQSQPCATITRASTLAHPGDTVLVGPGTYNTPTGPGGQIVYTAASGQPGLPITYLSQPRWGAVISQSTAGSAWSNSGSYVVIDGFEVVGNPASTGENGIYTSGQFTIIQHNKVHGIQPNTCTTLGASGINADAQFVTVRYNLSYSNGPAGCNFTHGIYLTQPYDIAADNILFLNAAYGVQANHGAYNEVIVNNTTFHNGSNGSGGGIFVGSSAAIRIDHNIVDNNIAYAEPNGISFELSSPATLGSNNVINNNLCDLATACLNLPLGFGVAKNDLAATDPKFVNYLPDGTGNYHLQSTSPAIHAGLMSDSTPDNQLSASFPAADFDGNPRPDRPGDTTYDLGALELAPHALAVVQVQNNIDTSGAAHNSLSVPITTSAGNLLVAFVREASNATDNFTVTDSAGQRWTLTSSGYYDESSSGPRIGMFYVANSASLSSVTVNFTTSGGVIKPGLMVMEISGAATLGAADGSATGGPSGPTTTTGSGSLTTTNPNDILIFAADAAADQTSWTAGAGYAIPNNKVSIGASGSNIRQAMQYAFVSSTQNNTTTSMTFQNSAWNGNIFAAFKLAAAGSAMTSSSPAAIVSPTSLTFPSQTLGTTSAAKKVVLSNTGTSALNITGIGVVGTNGGNFVASDNCSSSLAAGANCAIDVTFTPSASGTASASLQVSDNAGGSPQSVALTGTGVAPISAAPAVVQVQNNIDVSGTPYTSFSVPITTKAGDLLVAFIRESSNATDNFTVTDSAGQTWKLTSSGYLNECSTGPRIGMFYMANSAAVSNVTVHYATPGGVIKPGIMVMEISGAATTGVLDASVNGWIAASATSSTSGALTTTNANDILIFATDAAGNETGWTAGPGYAVPNNKMLIGASGSNVRMAMQYAVVSSIQSNTTTSTTYSNANWNGNIFAAFK